MDRTPKPGEFYRHFKNKLYQIIGIAAHSETGEAMVVYQALYGGFGLYVRPLDMFVSEVDREKYPEVSQRYRFERVTPGPGGSFEPAEQGAEKLERFEDGQVRGQAVSGQAVSGQADSSSASSAVSAPEEPDGEARPNPWLMKFLEAESITAQLDALKGMDGHVGQEEVDCLRVVLEMAPGGGSISGQLNDIRKNLEMQRRYDGSRLRGSRE